MIEFEGGTLTDDIRWRKPQPKESYDVVDLGDCIVESFMSGRFETLYWHFYEMPTQRLSCLAFHHEDGRVELITYANGGRYLKIIPKSRLS